VKLVSFGGLSAFYNYPLTEDGKYPMVYYIAPVILAMLIFSLYRLKTQRKNILFGSGFFLITIALVLQFVPAGNVIMADRYTYLPYVGLFFLIAVFAGYWAKQFKSIKPVLTGALIIYALSCAYYSYGRTKVWRDSLTFWNDTIEKNPDAALPYSNRAALFIQRKEYEKAIADLDKAIAIRPKYVTPHYNRGVLYIKIGKYKEAVEDLNFVMQNNPRDVLSVHMERGNAYMFGRNYPKAIEDFTSALKYNPELPPAFYCRGMSHHSMGNYEEALNDFNALIRLNPGFAKAYYLRAMTRYKLQDHQNALTDALKAKQMGYTVDPKFLKELDSKLKAS
jgi:protein O-mannosyl-transferase